MTTAEFDEVADELRKWAWAHHEAGSVQARQVLLLLAEREGLLKANALLAKGMESQAELTDGLKQENRRLAAELAAERRRCFAVARKVGRLLCKDPDSIQYRVAYQIADEILREESGSK